MLMQGPRLRGMRGQEKSVGNDTSPRRLCLGTPHTAACKLLPGRQLVQPEAHHVCLSSLKDHDSKLPVFQCPKPFLHILSSFIVISGRVVILVSCYFILVGSRNPPWLSSNNSNPGELCKSAHLCTDPPSVQFSSVQLLSHVQLFATHESQHTRPPCPSPTPRVHSDSRPLSQ